MPATQFRRVKEDEFDPYLKSLESVIDKYQLNKRLGAAAMDGIPQLGQTVDELVMDLNGMEDIISKYLTATVSQGNNLKVPSKTQRTRMLSASVPSKDIVPSVFNDKSFDLSNPHMFSAVTEFKDVIGASSDAILIIKELEDKLSNYSDTIEIYLLKEISKRSTSFFDALSHLKALQIETQYCGDQIATLRGSIETLSQTTAKKGLEVVRIKRRQGNLSIINGAVRLFSQLKRTQPLIRLMISQSDFVGALDMIDVSFSIISGKEKHREVDKVETLCKGITLTTTNSIVSKNFNFSSIKSIVKIRKNIYGMQFEIEGLLRHAFVTLLSADLKSSVPEMILEAKLLSPTSKGRYLNTPVMEWVKNIVSEKFSSSPLTMNPVVNTTMEILNLEQSLREQLTPILKGLFRMDKFSDSLNEYRKTLISLVKSFSNKVFLFLQKLYPRKNITVQDQIMMSLQQKSELKTANQAYVPVNQVN